MWLIAGRLLIACLTLVAVRWATSVLAPAAYGEMSLLVAVQTFCGLILVNPLGQHINRHTHRWWDDGTLLARLKSFAIYVVVVGMVGMGLAKAIGASGTTALVMLALVVSATSNTVLVPMLNMLGMRRGAVVLGVLTALACIGFSVALVAAEPSATGWLGGQSAGFAVGAVAAAMLLGRNAGRTLSRMPALPVISRVEVWRFCLPLALATGLMWAQLNGYRFLVEHYWSLAMLGVAAVGLALAGQCWSLVETIAQQLLVPPLYRRITTADRNDDPEGSNQSLSDYLNVIGPVYLVVAGTVLLGAQAMIRLLVDPRFASASFFLQIGALTECCRALAGAFGNAAQITKRTTTLSTPYLAGATITLIGVAVAGQQGADVRWIGLPMLVGAFAMLVIMAAQMRTEVRYTLRPGPWAAAGVAGTAAGVAAMTMSWQADGVWEAGLALLVLGLVSSATIAAILLKSPAIARSLAVSLHEAPRQ